MLQRHQKYIQIALNSNLNNAQAIISKLPISPRILIEIGTPLIKIYGALAVATLKKVAPSSYFVADTKCADLAYREVELFAQAGANAITCLGVAPIETIKQFIELCDHYHIDSMIDMMNVENPLLILKKLKTLPDAVILHRGVDETKNNEKLIPYYQIKQIKGSYNKIFISVAGGDTIQEIKSSVLNNADIVVLWKDFYYLNEKTNKLIKEFLNIIK
ncbi:MAG: orotidine 5'-phosphate decarboxylase [Patescibacteria group bacterium]|jgi:bifunctional enzyme Fae/Hps|nr:orotidine 5'-phosphate decarboxylase [Patescibacteria group bacterium]